MEEHGGEACTHTHQNTETHSTQAAYDWIYCGAEAQNISQTMTFCKTFDTPLIFFTTQKHKTCHFTKGRLAKYYFFSWHLIGVVDVSESMSCFVKMLQCFDLQGHCTEDTQPQRQFFILICKSTLCKKRKNKTTHSHTFLQIHHQQPTQQQTTITVYLINIEQCNSLMSSHFFTLQIHTCHMFHLFIPLSSCSSTPPSFTFHFLSVNCHVNQLLICLQGCEPALPLFLDI